MAAKPYRIGIVGASSLAGRELADTLAESTLAASDIVLLDDEDLAGQITAAGDEATFIQKIDADSFAAMDFVFFTGAPEATRKYWKAARLAGASIIDMTYALESEPGVVVRGPWSHLAGLSTHEPDLTTPLESEPGVIVRAPWAHISSPHLAAAANEPDLTTPAVVSAHPAALMLLLAASRIHAKLPIRMLAATVFEPASEHGRPAMDELHQQTVALLSFQTLPREQYDAQVAFNLLPSLGESARINLAATQTRILTQYTSLASAGSPELALQLAQAPVFHGYVASVFIELQAPATTEDVEASLHGESIEITTPDSDPPSNISAAGQPNVLATIRSTTSGDAPSTRFWLWLAADNLKLSALNAIACANEQRRLRPQGKVQ
jgi:aspartate-semialdehyde dehydrogenase